MSYFSNFYSSFELDGEYANPQVYRRKDVVVVEVVAGVQYDLIANKT